MESLFREGQRFQEYILLEKLPQGDFSEVWKAQSGYGKCLVCIKFFFCDFSHLQRQKTKLLEPCHPYLVKFLKLDFEYEIPYLIMPFMDKGNLKSLLHSNMCSEKALEIIRFILLALVCLHSQNIVHGSIKEENVLFQSPYNIYLSDWGWNTSPETLPSKDMVDLGNIIEKLILRCMSRNQHPKDMPALLLLKQLQEKSPFYPDAMAMLEDLHQGQRKIYQPAEDRFCLASSGEKIQAFSLDAFLLGSIFFIYSMPMPLSIALFLLYFLFLEGILGMTLGKKLLGLEICRKTEEKVDLGLALWRIILFYCALPFCFFFLLRKKSLNWHDRIAGTVVRKKTS
ncbi:MAG: protein kinase [Candidatus Brocadiae bacterium]|nr:protein kinase [Candidatus Brocadiia bacterium]